MTWIGSGRKQRWAVEIYYPGISVKNQDSGYPDQDSNQSPHGYQSEYLQLEQEAVP
jgi:hypothetical protein